MAFHRGLIAALLLLPLVVYSTAGRAQEVGEVYYGAQFLQLTYEEDGFPDFEPTALLFRFGKVVSPGFSAEGRLGIGVSDDSNDVGPFDLDFEIDHIIGGYLVGKAELGDSAAVYGLVGLSQVKASVDVSLGSASASDSEDESGLSYGFGAEFGPPRTRFTVEYMSYLDEDDFELTAVSIGVRF